MKIQANCPIHLLHVHSWLVCISLSRWVEHARPVPVYGHTQNNASKTTPYKHERVTRRTSCVCVCIQTSGHLFAPILCAQFPLRSSNFNSLLRVHCNMVWFYVHRRARQHISRSSSARKRQRTEYTKDRRYCKTFSRIWRPDKRLYMEIIRSLSPLHSKLFRVSNCVSLLVAKSTLKTNCANKRLLC